MRALVILYFLVLGGYEFWASFSGMGFPHSAGEIITSQNLNALMMIVTAIGLIKYRNWGRLLALGHACWSFVSGILLLLSGGLQSALIAAALISFFQGSPFVSMVITILIALILNLAIPIVIMVHLMRPRNASWYSGVEAEFPMSFLSRMWQQKDALIILTAVLFFGIGRLDAMLPKSFTREKENREMQAAFKEIANSDYVKNEVRRNEQEKGRDHEAQFEINQGFFSRDQKKLIFAISTGALCQLEISTGTLSKLATIQGALWQRSNDDRFFLKSDQNSVYDLQQKQDRKTIFLGNLSKKSVGIGFGPLPNSFLLYEIPEKAWVLRNIFDGGEIWRLPDPEITSESISSYWFPTGHYVAVGPGDAGLYMIDALNGKYAGVDKAMHFASSVFIEQDEQGLISLKKYPDRFGSSWFDFRSRAVKPLEIEGTALGFSLKADFLLVSISGPTSGVRLYRPSQNFKLEWEENLQVERALVPKGSMAALIDGGGQLVWLNLTTKAKRGVGLASVGGRGILVASNSGDLIAHSSQRTLQILWRSELDKDIPHFYSTQVSDDCGKQ